MLWLCAAPAAAKGKAAHRPIGELTNYALGPELAQWLVGPIVALATGDEVARYLALTDDESARRFIETFWELRGPNRVFPPAGPRYVFEERAERADVQFREGTRVGRRTDRGTLYVLYGPPRETLFEASRRPGGSPLEIWAYGKDAEPGLDGEKPRRSYAFAKVDGETRLVSRGTGRVERLPQLGRRRIDD